MKTIIHTKVDKDIKAMAQNIAQELGLTLSAVMNAYLRQFIRNKALYISIEPQMSHKLESLLHGIEEDIFKQNNLSLSFTNGVDIDNYLNLL